MYGNEKNSMLCPHCRRLISADEPACPYCGLSNPGSKFKRRFFPFFSPNSMNVVKTLIIINAVFYLLSLLLSPSALGLSPNPLTFLSPSNRSLFLLGATGTLPISYGRWWTLVSASFLHGGILHIFFNMAALSQLGPFVLREFGFSRFVILYLCTGVAGFFLSCVAGIPFTIGASASICGLIGAILYYGKSRGGFYGEIIYRQAMGWVIGLVFFGLLVPGINNWAHGGGLVSGIFLAFLLGYRERREESVLHRFLASGFVAATILILLWSILQAIYSLFRFPVGV